VGHGLGKNQLSIAQLKFSEGLFSATIATVTTDDWINQVHNPTELNLPNFRPLKFLRILLCNPKGYFPYCNDKPNTDFKASKRGWQ